MTELRVIEECPTSWRSHHGATWHRCVLMDGLHEGDHECACGATMSTLRGSLEPCEHGVPRQYGCIQCMRQQP